jgi:hypothetical protein
MKTNDLIKDPVFQLNLILWMTKPQPSEGYRVRPFFHEQDFQIYYIESSFKYPEETMNSIKAKENEINISSGPEPDVIIGRENDGKALYFEGKAQSFGENSSNTKQAYGHLLACGPIFSEVLSPLKSSLLCYVVPESDHKKMSGCLKSLSKNLSNNGFKPGEYSTHGLAYERSKIVYSWDMALKKYVNIPKNKIPIMDEIPDDTDPSPLVLVFSDEDCKNPEIRDFYRQVVIHQVRACLLCDLHSHPIGSIYQTIPDKILDRTTGDLFQYMGPKRQKGLRRLVFENIFKQIFDYWEDRQPGIKLEGNQISVSWSLSGEKDAFLDWLEDKHTCFSTIRPTEETTSDWVEMIKSNPVE